jgi:flagellar biosynthesis regulator FlaF
MLLQASRCISIAPFSSSRSSACPRTQPRLQRQQQQQRPQHQLWQQAEQQLLRSSCIVRSFDNATKELQEAAQLDELIDMLMAAKSEQELSRVVAENIFKFDPKFWLRVATRNDSITDADQKDRLRAVADSVMILVDTMVKQTEQQLNDSAAVLQDILKAAADEKGEWYLPLDPAQVAAVRAALDKHSDRLDEALLSNCFAWMKKCQDDRMDTMVTLLQKILQLYASKALKGPETSGPEGVLNEVVYAEEKDWDGIIKQSAAGGKVAEAAFMEALQKKMELIVLGMQSGSYAQRVQAEFLKEVEARAKSVYRELAAAGKQ